MKELDGVPHAQLQLSQICSRIWRVNKCVGLSLSLLSLFKIFFHWEGRITERKNREKDFPHIGSLSKWQQWLELCQSKDRSEDSLLGLPCRRSVLRFWVVLHCSLRPNTGSWIRHAAYEIPALICGRLTN